MSKFNGSVQITKDLYFGLAARDYELSLLEEAGVDSWLGVDNVKWEDLDRFREILSKTLRESSSMLLMYGEGDAHHK